MGAQAAGFTALRLHVGEAATAEPPKCLTETKCQPIVKTDGACAGEKQTGVTDSTHKVTFCIYWQFNKQIYCK